MYITRFAPSPTGHLHIGGARTALFCWAFAKKTRGHFLLRIEDTDQARSSEASARGIMEDLAWLGIAWDEGPELQSKASSHPGIKASSEEQASVIGGDPRRVAPFYQSQRLDLYNRVVDSMIDRGIAYADFTPGAKLDEMRKAATAKKETFRYHPPQSEILPIAEQQKKMASGESHVVRLRSPEEPVAVMDEVLGEVKFGAGEVDDFVLRKADGFPTYHFGVVVDDEMMGVTHVLRGQEHLMNTPRHVMLQRVLGYRTPVYAHMPLIFNDQGAKMSKRERDQAARAAVKQKGIKDSPVAEVDAATWSGWLADTKKQLETSQLEAVAGAIGLALPEVSVEDFRKAGYLPEVICNYIALLGWNPGMKNPDGTDLDRFDMTFLAQHFDLSRIGKTNSRFDRRKLLAFNGDAINKLSDEEFAARWRQWCERFDARLTTKLDVQRFLWLARAVKPRCKTLADAIKPAMFVVVADEELAFDDAAMKKSVLAPVNKDGTGPRGVEVLRELSPVLENIDPFEPGAINTAIEAFAASKGLQIGAAAQPIRVAMTGTAVSPGLGETLAVLGKSSVLARLRRCLASAGGA
ncbi:MAG TPA: glutamate--tRNA ligase [Phycisphaerales bacterium]|nr:glutamate--tRNA ligase [Phycisphaerales bacterium]